MRMKRVSERTDPRGDRARLIDEGGGQIWISGNEKERKRRWKRKWMRMWKRMWKRKRWKRQEVEEEEDKEEDVEEKEHVEEKEDLEEDVEEEGGGRGRRWERERRGGREEAHLTFVVRSF